MSQPMREYLTSEGAPDFRAQKVKSTTLLAPPSYAFRTLKHLDGAKALMVCSACSDTLAPTRIPVSCMALVIVLSSFSQNSFLFSCGISTSQQGLLTMCLMPGRIVKGFRLRCGIGVVAPQQHWMGFKENTGRAWRIPGWNQNQPIKTSPNQLKSVKIV